MTISKGNADDASNIDETIDENNVDTDTTEVETDQEETENEDSEIDYKAEYEKQKKIAENQRIRAEKAEKNSKTAKPVNKSTQSSSELSGKDVIALTSAGVTESDDIDEVMEIAKLKKISIAETLKLGITKTILAEKKEQRETANATATGGQRRGSSRVSEQTLIEKASRGELPESAEDMRRLAEAQMAQKKKRK